MPDETPLLPAPLASPPLRRTLGVPHPRRRGAQPGNTNALKHGFYARNLPLNDTAGLDDLPLDALADEITLLRILIRRVAENIGPDQSLEKSAEYLRVVTFSMTCLTRLMRTQTYIGINPPRQNPFQDLLHQALRELAVERESEPLLTEPKQPL
jgi:hypothetical protein